MRSDLFVSFGLEYGMDVNPTRFFAFSTDSTQQIGLMPLLLGSVHVAVGGGEKLPKIDRRVLGKCHAN